MSTGYFERSFASCDPAESEDWLSTQYGGVRLGARFESFTERMAGDDRMLITEVGSVGTYQCLVRSKAVLVVAATPGTSWELRRDSGCYGAEPCIFEADRPFLNHMGGSGLHAVVLAPVALQRTARLLYARDDLQVHFDGPRAAGPRSAAYWLAALEVARRQARSGALASDLVRANTYRLLAVAALQSFRLLGDRRELRTSAERRLKVYRAGSGFLRDFASLPVTIDDAAQAAGTSIRELVLAFRSHTDGAVGPTAYLKKVRLSAARDDLAVSGVSVRDVALRWGFADEGVFSSDYRREYGAPPGGAAVS